MSLTTKRNLDSARPRHRVRPMLATAVDAPFDRADWFFEIKWDGYRAIADTRAGVVDLYSRNQLSFNARFPAIVAALQGLKHNALLDGEVVALALDGAGKPHFNLLQNYHRARKGRLAYFVFDLLELDGRDFRGQPLRRRKQALAKLIANNSTVLLSEHVEERGIDFFKAAADQGLEGIVAKNAASPYREEARTLDWLKIKTHMRQEAVIGGFTRPRGGRQNFGALVLGVYQDGKLVYIGHTGGGFDEQSLADVRVRLEPLRQTQCPFAQRPKTNAPAQWVKPVLVCEVKFQNWSEDGHMRHPIFMGLREDKHAEDVHREFSLPVGDATKKPKI